MASSVATPLEKQFSTIAGVTVDQLAAAARAAPTSRCSSILSRNIDSAAQDVQSMIARASRGAAARHAVAAVVPEESIRPTQPVLFLTLSSTTLPLSQVDRYAETVLAQRLSMVSGVAQVNVFGAQKFAVRVDVDPTQLAARQIGIDQVAHGDQRRERQPADRHALRPEPQLRRAVERPADDRPSSTGRSSSPTATAARCGSSEVANVYDGVENPRNASWYNGTPAIYLAHPAPARHQHRRSRRRDQGAAAASCRRSCRRRSSSTIRSDRSVSIRESVHDVKFTLLLTVVLVVLVIFLFLRNLSATIIPSLALPFSIVGTFAVMWALDYSLDNLSLMALTLSVGFVVDDAIVMLENIVRHMEMGKPRMQAALDGSKEIAFTIVSMTLSLAAVFIPILFMGGIVGRLMHEFAVTIARGDPGVGPRLADADADAVQPLPEAAALDAATAGSTTSIETDVRRAGCSGYALDADADDPLQGRRRWWCSALLLVGTVYLFGIVPKGFIPSVDTGPAERPDRGDAGHRLRRDGGAHAGR